MKAKKTAKKPAKTSAAKPADAKKPAIYKVAKKFEGGVREKAQSAIPSKGATFDTILKTSKFPEHKLRGYLGWMCSNGFVKKISPAA